MRLNSDNNIISAGSDPPLKITYIASSYRAQVALLYQLLSQPQSQRLTLNPFWLAREKIFIIMRPLIGPGIRKSGDIFLIGPGLLSASHCLPLYSLPSR